MKNCLFIYTWLLGCLTVHAQDYRTALHVKDKAQYLAQASADSNFQLVEIAKVIPSIKLDIRYASANNFMRQRMYNQARAFARLAVVNALKQVQNDLKQHKLGLKIFDAYRPYTVTVQFYKKAKDSTFVASPRTGSKHNRGCAIDLTLIELRTGKDIEMPTGFDSFSEKAAANYPDLSAKVMHNRELLKTAMQAHGFKVYPAEWWHFDFTGWEKYDLLDVPFEQL
jgi:D-alanyl-D-alanine dipeptidase